MAEISEILASPELMAKCPNTKMRAMFNNIIDLAFCGDEELEQGAVRLRDELKVKSPKTYKKFQQYFSDFVVIRERMDQAELNAYDAQLATDAAKIADYDNSIREDNAKLNGINRRVKDLDGEIAEHARVINAGIDAEAARTLPAARQFLNTRRTPVAYRSHKAPAVARDAVSGSNPSKGKCSIM